MVAFSSSPLSFGARTRLSGSRLALAVAAQSGEFRSGGETPVTVQASQYICSELLNLEIVETSWGEGFLS